MKILFLNDKSSGIPEYLVNWMLRQTGFFFENNEELTHSCSMLLVYGKPEYLKEVSHLQNELKPLIYIPAISLDDIQFRDEKPQLLYTEQNIHIPVWAIKNPGKDLEALLAKKFAFDFSPAMLMNKANRQIQLIFDPFANASFHLNRFEEQAEENDFHPEETVLSQHLLVPVVDYFIDLLKNLLIEVAQHFSAPLLMKKRWPCGKEYAFSISHNVNLTHKWGIKRALKSLAGHFIHFRFKKIVIIFKEIFLRKNSYWTFPRLIELYKNHDWQSTFFFLAKCIQWPNYHYNISNKKFRSLFHLLRQHNHEIGLHNSSFSFGDRKKVQKEIHKLKHHSNTPILGTRQYLQNLQYPAAFEFYAGLHFDYDSTMAYKGKAGYRAGISLPYPAAKGPDKRLYEIPYLFCDRHLAQNENWDEFVNQQIQIIKKVNGFFHFIWHPGNLVEPPFSEIFFHIVKKLYENESENYNFSLGKILNWKKSWDKIKLRVISRDNNHAQLSLYSNSDISELVFEIVGKEGTIDFENESDLHAEQKSPSQIQLRLEAGKQSQLQLKLSS